LKRRVILGLVFGLVASFSMSAAPPPGERASAIFAGGCFWCEETAFEGLPGVISVTSGYTGGQKKNPTYEEVSAGGTGHAESVEVVFDPAKTSYERLLEVFWHNVDPFQKETALRPRDAGIAGRSLRGEAQRKAAEESKRNSRSSRGPWEDRTQIVAAIDVLSGRGISPGLYKKIPRYHSYRAAPRRPAEGNRGAAEESHDYASLFAAFVALALALPANGRTRQGKGWNGSSRSSRRGAEEEAGRLSSTK
jgi:peptide-methionine (S)-S-oxide reductase